MDCKGPIQTVLFFTKCRSIDQVVCRIPMKLCTKVTLSPHTGEYGIRRPEDPENNSRRYLVNKFEYGVRELFVGFSKPGSLNVLEMLHDVVNV